MKEPSILFSHPSDDWETPPALFERLSEEFPFILDVCANKDNAKVPLYIDKQLDGLRADWHALCQDSFYYLDKFYVWMHPPHSQLEEWVKKAVRESFKKITTVALLPAYTDTDWFHDFIYTRQPRVHIRFLKDKLMLSKNCPAPCPYMIVTFNSCYKYLEINYE